MSEQHHSWKVVRSVCGWCVEHTGPAGMEFQPDQFGKVRLITRRLGFDVPMTFEELRRRIKDVPSRLNGKRFGDRFSDARRNVCCEYAAELNSKEA